MMARNTSVSLGDHLTDFIDAQVQAGRYGSASDVVRAGLRLLQEHEAKVRALEFALIEGERSGEPQRSILTGSKLAGAQPTFADEAPCIYASGVLRYRSNLGL